MTISRPSGFHRVFGYHASINSYRQGRGIMTTRKRSSKPIASYTRISLMRGNASTPSRSCFPIVSSTAVMDQRVGTNRRFFSIPYAPTLKARWILETGVPQPYRSTTASFARRSVSEKARSRFGSTLSVPTSRRRNGAEGPNGWMLSSRTTRPSGFRENPTSTSAGDVPRASSRVRSTIRPPPSTSCTWTRCIPRTSCDRNWTMSSIEWPIHASGVSRIWVSPWTGGTSGPTYTFGYPNRPTKTPGGDDPSISTRSIIAAVLIMRAQRTRAGQRVWPQRRFAPRHWMHNPLAMAACVSASKIAANAAGAGWTGRESIAVSRTRGDLRTWRRDGRSGTRRVIRAAGSSRIVKENSPLALTTEDRILLYFSDFRNMEERYVLPQALTQKAIAFAAGIQRKHLSRYLDEMVRDGFLTETKAHIEGEKQRMLAYYLAPRGWERAMGIKERLSKVRVPVKVAGTTKEMSLEEIDRATSVHLTLSDIVREAMNVDELDLEYLEGIDDRRKRAMDERVKRLEDYTRAVMTAWKDGRVSATERLLVEQLRENLGISREEQERIESEVLEEVIENRAGIYRAVAAQALEDGPITEDERELLEALRKKLGLSARDCREIEAEIGKPAS